MAVIHVNWDFQFMIGTFNSIEFLHRQFVSHKDEIRAAEEKAMKEPGPRPDGGFTIPPMSFFTLDYYFNTSLPELECFSSIAMAYSAVEFWIQILCDLVKERDKLSYSFSEFEGNAVDKLQAFGKKAKLPQIDNMASLFEKPRSPATLRIA